MQNSNCTSAESFTIFDFAVTTDFAIIPAHSFDPLNRNFSASYWDDISIQHQILHFAFCYFHVEFISFYAIQDLKYSCSSISIA
jgi:hypothetical protein